MRNVRIVLSLVLAVGLLAPMSATQRVGLVGSGVPRVAPGVIEEPPVDPPDGVFTDADMTVLGTMHLPTFDGDYSYTQGPIAVRYVDGVMHVFVTGRSFQANGSEKLLELNYPGVGGTMTELHDYGYVWGDINNGGGGVADQHQIYSIFWDDDINGTGQQGIIYTYGPIYTQNNNPFVGYLIFDENDNITSCGNWGMPGVPSQSTKGYVVKAPPDVYAATGFRYWAGSHNTANNGTAAFGTYAQMFNLPDCGEPSDAFSLSGTGYAITGALKGPQLDPHSIGNRFRLSVAEAYRPAYWTYYNSSVYNGVGPPNDQYWPPNNPVQDGTGCNIPSSPISECGAYILSKFADSTHGGPYEASDVDTIAFTTYIQGLAKRGVLFIGSFAWTFPEVTYAGDGYNHWWYGPMNNGSYGLDPFGQYGSVGRSTGDNTRTMANLLFIRDPASYINVFHGDIANPENVVAEKHMYTLAHSGAPFPQYATQVQPPFVAGAAWASEHNVLLVTQPNAESIGCCGELKEVIWVIQIDVD